MSNQFEPLSVPLRQQGLHRVQFRPIAKELGTQPTVKVPKLDEVKSEHQVWEPKIFGHNIDGDPKIDQRTTIPLRALNGIWTQQTQSLPVAQTKISDRARKAVIARFANHETVLLGLALLLVSFFSLFLIGSKSFWLDEAYSIELVHYSWQSMWQELFTYDRNAWLYYTLLYGWARLDDAEDYIRLLSALFAITSLPVYYLLSKKLFGKKVALIAAFLLAINGFYIRYAQEARAYSLSFLLCLLSTLIFLYLLNKQSKLLYFLYTFCVILSIYAHAFSVFLLAIHALIVLYTSRSIWKQYAICAFITSVCAFPILFSQGRAKDALAWLPPVHVQTLAAYFLRLSAGQPILCLLYAILCGLATVWILSMMWKARNYPTLWKYAFVYIWLFLPLLLTFFYSLLIFPIFNSRYLLIGLAPFLLLVSIGLTRIRHRLLFYLNLVCIAVLSLLPLIGWYTGDQHLTLKLSNSKEDWRTAITYVCNQATLNDGVTFYAYVAQIPYEYYAQHNPVCLSKHLHEIELASSPFVSGGGGNLPAPNLLRLKNLPTSTNQIWLIVSHVGTLTQRVAQRNMIQQMLAKAYSLVSTKKFLGIELRLYARNNGLRGSVGTEKTDHRYCSCLPSNGSYLVQKQRSP